MKTFSKNWVMLCMLTLLFACQPNSQTTDGQSGVIENEIAESVADFAQVTPPIPGQEVAFSSFTIETSSEQIIDLDNGTQIIIPANSLVDSQGNPITGEATLQYREFHDVVDVLFSGIPMGVMDGDKREIFQTAGMMEIRAEQNGQDLTVDANNPISVKMTSYQFAKGKEVDTKGYGQYYLNQANGRWESLQAQDQPTIARLAPEKFQAPPMIPVEPTKPREASNMNEAFDFAVDYKEFPALASFKNILWEYAEIEEAGTVNPNQDTWVFAEAWTDAKISAREGSKQTFYVDLSRSNKSARMIVRPVVSNEDFQDAMALYNKKQAEFREAKLANERALANARNQIKMASLFNVVRFGFHNIDRYFKIKKPKVVKARITYLDTELKKEIPIVYHVIKDANAVIPYEQVEKGLHYWNNDFRYFKDEKNVLVSFLGGVIYSFGSAQFRRALIGNRHTFELKPSGEATAKSMRKLIRL